MIERPEPKANPAAVLLFGKARFTLITDRLLRLEYCESGRFTDDASLVFINRNLPVPAFETKLEDDTLEIKTEFLELHYRQNSGKFSRDNICIRLLNFMPETIWTPGMMDGQNLLGTTHTLDETDGDVKLEKGIISRSGWALIDDSRTPLLDDSSRQWVKARGGKQAQDWYFFGYGHRYLDAIRDYCLVAGRIPMPPRFAFGYWWSRHWAYSDAELRGLFDDFKKHRLPLNVLVIDMDWHETKGLSCRNPEYDSQGELIGFSGYTWNKELFPDPQRFLAEMHERGIRIALNLHPASGISKDEEHYADFARLYGKKPSKDRSYPFAMEEKKWAEAYFGAIIESLEKEGVDFWWLDWQAWKDSKQIPGLNNIWWLNHVFFTHKQRNGKKRSLLLARWGGLGNHRYQIGFCGDTWISWKSLANLPYFTATAGNVGYGYWSHDIGGHKGEAGSAELYLRWLQFGALSPILRTHATKDSELERRIWKFPDHYDAMREALLLRHSLTPYLYGAARAAFDEGISLCRPLYWFYPEHEEAYQNPGQYFLGEDLMVVPITHAADEMELVNQNIWLPPGLWYDVCHGALMEGGRSIKLAYTLQEIPTFGKAGAIIPLLPEDQCLGEASDLFILDFYPGADGKTRLYEDDGNTDQYQAGVFACTEINQHVLDRLLKISISATKGSFTGMPQLVSYQLNIIGRFPPKQVICGKTALPYSAVLKEGHWSYDGSRLAIQILLPPSARNEVLDCALHFTAQADARKELLNGIPGVLKRLPEVLRSLKKEFNRFDAIANPPETILNLGSTVSRLDYDPKSAMGELTSFPEKLIAAITCIAELEGIDSLVLEKLIRFISLHRTIPARPRIIIKSKGNQALVEMQSPDSDAVIRYTHDSSLPTEYSYLFRKPLLFKRMAIISARAFAPGCLQGFPISALFHYQWVKKISYLHPNSPKYDGGGARALVNGSLGNQFDYRKNWVGFEACDAILDIELIRPMILKSMLLRFLRDQSKWIFYPRQLKIEVSLDGMNYQKVFQKNLQTFAYFPDLKFDILSVNANLRHPDRIRYLRISAKNIGLCPEWHSGSGGKAWIFMDEILIAEG
ncbi:MAG: glycoside hydrolase family 31 protein [Candidatus Cloacimonadaceae bacterium]|nr:glycoside hydrolase family 31 protein [Candidatus Cloacimonadaceae bacterium]MDP3115455.1 glycoside hydrolase family 31 protein [Candidatus Cloacimonadaceae bacterium]